MQANFRNKSSVFKKSYIRLWLVSLMPAVQDVVVVEGVDMGAGSQKEMSQVHYLIKVGEVRACKDLKGNVFTIRSGNKGKDGDMLHTSKEKLALYIGTNYGDDAC